MKYINLGNSDFKSIIEGDNYFVDKSLFIKEIIRIQSQVLLIPRPRRFGKTLNLSMLRYFFDVRHPENQTLFANLKIWQCEDEIKWHQGKYPVIYLSFKDAKLNSWKDCLSHIQLEIAGIFEQYKYLLNNDLLSEAEAIIFNEIRMRTVDKTVLQSSLKLLSEYLYRYYNQKVVILIDEYDAPIQSGYKKYYDDVISFMRNLLSGAYKDNSYLFKGIITGILRVSRESIFSGLNNIAVYSVLNYEFSDKFGFTESEVKQIISDFDVKTAYSDIKKWYDGYQIGDTANLYNPWSILNFAAAKHEHFDIYWANTSSNELIKDEIKNKDADPIRQDVLKLISGEAIKRDLEPNFVFPDLQKRKTLLWTLLTYSGYLTVEKQISRKEYMLKIPNYEIKTIFQDTIIEWFEGDIKVVKTRLEETTNYLITNQLQKFENGFRQIMGDTFSYYDTATNHEYVYQTYTLGLLAIIGDDYIIKSNRESGEGRYDILLIPHDKTRYGIVIEIKQTNSRTESESDRQFVSRINASLAKAMRQIDTNEYYKELIDNKISKDKIIKVPIVFAGKTPFITDIKLNNNKLEH